MRNFSRTQSFLAIWRNRRSAPGFVIIYFLIAWMLMIGFCSLSVDYGRVWLVKSQLQDVADAAARAAMFSFQTGGVTAAKNAAVAIAAANTVDGATVTIVASTDVIFGTWSPSTQVFTTLTGAAQSTANAIEVQTQRSTARGNPVPLLFASLLGQSGCNAHAQAIACVFSPVALTNASFESPALSAGNYIYDETMPGWTLTGYACLETYGSAWGGPQPSGNQAISLQGGYGGTGTISQSFSGTAGNYSVSFLAAERTSYYSGSSPLQPVSVCIDGTQIAIVSPTSGNFATYTTPTITLAAGTHTLTMSSTINTNDETTFVDNVSIKCSSGLVTLAN
jgi:Flp pilus assembly protein TadG